MSGAPKNKFLRKGIMKNKIKIYLLVIAVTFVGVNLTFGQSPSSPPGSISPSRGIASASPKGSAASKSTPRPAVSPNPSTAGNGSQINADANTWAEIVDTLGEKTKASLKEKDDKIADLDLRNSSIIKEKQDLETEKLNLETKVRALEQGQNGVDKRVKAIEKERDEAKAAFKTITDALRKVNNDKELAVGVDPTKKGSALPQVVDTRPSN